MDELVVGDYYYVSSISEDHARKLRELKYASRPRKCTSLRGKFKLEKDCYRYMKYWVKENAGMKIEDIKIGMKVFFKGGYGINRGIVTVRNVDDDCVAIQTGELSIVWVPASDLTPYEERYTCNIPGVTVELIPGKKYWVSAESNELAVKNQNLRTYICTIGGAHHFEGSDYYNSDAYPTQEFSTYTWKYTVDPDTYKEPETEMTIEEVAEALRKSGAITGKLKIKE